MKYVCNDYKYKICSYSKKFNDLLNIFKLNNQKQIIKWQILNSRNVQNLILNFIGFTPETKRINRSSKIMVPK